MINLPVFSIVVIGWESENYTISEALPMAELCATISSGQVMQTLVVSLSYGNGTALG